MRRADAPTGSLIPLAIWLGLVAGFVPGFAAADVFLDFGVASTVIQSRIASPTGAVNSNDRDVGLHLGFGARKAINENSDIGVRIEFDTVDEENLLALRAFDYRRHHTERLASSYYIGAGRLSLSTPAWGYYFGLGVELKEFFAELDLGIDIRYGDKLARDNLLPSDPQAGSPDNFHDVVGFSVYLKHKF